MSDYPRLDETGLTTLVNRLAQVIKVSNLQDVELTDLQGGQILKYNSDSHKWVNANDDTGSGLKIGDVSGATTSVVRGVKSVTLTWTDPNDIIVSDIPLAVWSGTIVVRKKGSAPTNRFDGTVVVNSKVRNQYATNGFVDNTVDALNATYYYRFFPYTEGNLYTDGSSVSATTLREIVAIPVPSDTLVYDGTEQTMTFTYDSTKVSISGDSAITAGTHIATASIIDTDLCEWSDGTTADKDVSWSMAKAKVSEPTVSSSLVYNGSEQTASVTAYDDSIISITGLTGTNAGSYTATLSIIDDNYWWIDETTADKTQSWSIAKASGGCTFSTNPAVLDPSHLSTTVTISNATGTIGTPTSSDTTICTVSKSGNTLTITSANTKNGTVTISVPIGASDNYNATTAYLTVNSSVLAIVTWANGTDAQVSAMLTAHYNGFIDIHDYWKVGDTRNISLSAIAKDSSSLEEQPAQTIQMTLMNATGYPLTTPINGKTTSAFIVGQKNPLSVTGKISMSAYTPPEYAQTARCVWFASNSGYKSGFPSTISGIFKQFKKKFTFRNGTSSTSASNIYFALPSRYELLGDYPTSITKPDDEIQFKYYETAANRIKYINGTAVAYWTRTPLGGDAKYYNTIKNDGKSGAIQQNTALGIAPFGCI